MMLYNLKWKFLEFDKILNPVEFDHIFIIRGFREIHNLPPICVVIHNHLSPSFNPGMAFKHKSATFPDLYSKYAAPAIMAALSVHKTGFG